MAKKGKKSTTCGGKDCGACKACCDEFEDKNDELRELTSKNEEMIAQVQAENKALLDTQLVLKETESAMRGKIINLTKERDKLNVNLLATTLKKKKSGSGRWKVRHLSGEDRPAQEVVSTVVKEVLFPNMKDLPAGWEEFNEDENTACGLIMKMINPPSGKSKEEYWLEIVRESVNYKFGQFKRQASNKLKRVVNCE